MSKPEMDQETIEAQRMVFESLVRAGEGYLCALTRAIYLNAIYGPENIPNEIKVDLNTTRKQLLDVFQLTLAK